MCEGMIFFVDYPCISNPTGTNKPNFSCLLCKNCWKNILLFFFKRFMFDTGIFFCSVYYYIYFN